jgi:DNA-directed RNA polymerase subunit RPC12/RpoP
MAYCDRCERWFNSEHAYDAHRRDSRSHYMCWKCDKDFQTSGRLDQHLRQSSRHHFCTYCDEDFDDQYDLDEHDQECHEYCQSCNLVRFQTFGLIRGGNLNPFFVQWLETTDDLVEHNKEDHYYCVECDRLFMNLNNLQNVCSFLRSSATQITSNPG